MSFLRFIFRVFGLLLALFLLLPFVILVIAITQKTKKRKLNKWVINNWSKTLCFVCGIKLKIEGKIQENPVFIVANHVSWLDIPVIHSAKLVGFVAKDEISKWPILGWIVKSGETLFIARGKHESRKKVLDRIKDRLKQHRSIAVFPEGKVTDGSHVGRFHRQLMHAAVETATPIQAIAIKYYNKDGDRNKHVCFIDEENFLSNVFRILSLPISTAELTFCKTIETEGKSAREVAIKTHQQVLQALSVNDYI